MNKTFIALGSIFIIIGICLFLSIPHFFIESHKNSIKLLQEYDKQQVAFQTHQKPKPAKAATHQEKRLTKSDDHLLGKIVLHTIKTEAPIVEGTDKKDLKNGAGHVTTSVLPGEKGTSVIAAHNTTFFHDIGKLKKDDMVQIDINSKVQTFVVYQTEIVKTGAPIYNTEIPTVILETCYPFDTINQTPYRYLVFAKIKIG